MARPGIMLYFDILEPIRVLSDADKGRLLVAMMEYGQYGTLPQFDGMLALAWGFVLPKLDRDEESYENAKVQRQYAAFCKRRNSRGLSKIPFEQWQQMNPEERKRMSTEDNEPLRPVDFVNGRNPSTTTTATATASTTTTTSTTAAAAVTTTEGTDFAAAAAEKKVKMLGGELGKGVVFLSDNQVEGLLELLGIDAFDYYVDKLSAFIIKNNAHVKDHYATILKWWQQDSESGGGA